MPVRYVPHDAARVAEVHRRKADVGYQLQTVGAGQRIDVRAEREAQYEAERELARFGWMLTFDFRLVPTPKGEV